MSEQIVDLRSAWAILRRRARILAVIVLLGALGGAYFGYSRPDVYQSTSLVLLPLGSPDPSGQDQSRQVDTQAQIALSDVVLGPAGHAVTPRMTAEEMQSSVEVAASTDDVLQITSSAETAVRAEAITRAVATADVNYLASTLVTLSQDQRLALEDRRQTLKGSLAAVTREMKKTSARLETEPHNSTAGKADAAALAELTAQQASVVLQIDQLEKELSGGKDLLSGQPGGDARVIQQASPAEKASVPLRIGLYGLAGLLATLVLATTVVVSTGRRDKRLRSRDQLADSIAVPVLASLHSRATKAAAGWTTLLLSYEPDHVDQWSLHQMLRAVTGRSSTAEGGSGGSRNHVVVLSLADDLRALAVGPQLASFAASRGMRTQLLPTQTHESAETLWAACSRFPQSADRRPQLLVGDHEVSEDADLVVHVVVLDRTKPRIDIPEASPATTLLAVSSGSATLDDMARTAVAADEANHPIDGLVVADPDPLDRTSGRLLPTEREHQASLPTLMTGSVTSGGPAQPASRRRLT
ncbi:MAG TPA: hypothetical protein VFJ12_07795 [Segeticoccus sp.]|nr:hypothetical protein [Segeticoccus sp.]